MIMKTVGRGKAMGSGKNSVVFGKYRLEVRMHRWCLNYLHGIELGNNVEMSLFEELFHSMENDDTRGECCDSLELVLLAILSKFHGQFLKIHEDETESA
jgi:hypothetical protein